MRRVLMILGGLGLVFGLLFMAQGSGLFPYPAESFMIGASVWIGYGSMIAALGACLILIARRIRR
jgi:hypothetical protein